MAKLLRRELLLVPDIKKIDLFGHPGGHLYCCELENFAEGTLFSWNLYEQSCGPVGGNSSEFEFWISGAAAKARDRFSRMKA